MDIFQKKFTSIGKETVFGAGIWLLVFIAFALLRFQYDYLTTSFDQTVAGLETRTTYLERITSEACAGDIVNYRSPSLERRYIREVEASAGSSFQVLDNGYSIDGTVIEKHENWTQSARQIIGNQTAITISNGQSLIINSEFDPSSERNTWPFEIIENKQIREKITHILFSRDLFKIGSRVGNVDGCT